MADTEGMQKMLPETGVLDRKCTRQPLCAQTSYSCSKMFLFIYTLSFLFVGIGLMALGVLVETHRQQVESMNNHLALPVTLLILVGLIITINAVCGMVGTLTENLNLLRVFLVITVVSFIIQVMIGIAAFIYREQVTSIIAPDLMFVISGYGHNSRLTKAMDYVQTQYHCCGLRTFADYSQENEIFNCNSGKPQACGVPSSCCRDNVTEKSETCGYTSDGNLKGSDVYTSGCTDAFIQWLADDMDVTGAVTLGFAIPQIIGILLVFFFIRRVSEYQTGYRVGQYFG